MVTVGVVEYKPYHQQYRKTLISLCRGDVVSYNHLPSNPPVDILFVNTVPNLPMDWARFIGWNPDCKTVLTVHEANSELRYPNPIIKKFDAIVVTYPPIKKFAEKYYDGSIYILPYSLYEGERRFRYFNPYYVVPGKIENFRRDYSLVSGYEPLCFLGQPVGKRGRLIAKQADLYFDDYVPDYLYDDMLRGCRAILAPLRNPTRSINRITSQY
jgi:hypothetical protein